MEICAQFRFWHRLRTLSRRSLSSKRLRLPAGNSSANNKHAARQAFSPSRVFSERTREAWAEKGSLRLNCLPATPAMLPKRFR